MHIHVASADGEAKDWIEPSVELAKNYWLGDSALHRIEALIAEHREEIRNAWDRHFGN